MKYTVFTILSCAAVVGACVKPPYAEVKMQDYQPIETPNAERVTITRLGVFKDEIAYDGRRAIYLIADKTSGKEFIGISGVGIAEVRDHPSGESRFEDER